MHAVQQAQLSCKHSAPWCLTAHCFHSGQDAHDDVDAEAMGLHRAFQVMEGPGRVDQPGGRVMLGQQRRQHAADGLDHRRVLEVVRQGAL
eukprot:scaffold370719_cov34-Prasinocladus_malaysianus.AAC.1